MKPVLYISFDRFRRVIRRVQPSLLPVNEEGCWGQQPRPSVRPSPSPTGSALAPNASPALSQGALWRHTRVGPLAQTNRNARYPPCTGTTALPRYWSAPPARREPWWTLINSPRLLTPPHIVTGKQVQESNYCLTGGQHGGEILNKHGVDNKCN